MVGKGREGVNLSPGVGDWGFCSGSTRSEAKGLGGLVSEGASRATASIAFCMDVFILHLYPKEQRASGDLNHGSFIGVRIRLYRNIIRGV